MNEPCENGCNGCDECTDFEDRDTTSAAPNHECRAAFESWAEGRNLAVVEPLTPIRRAALDLYMPPFRHEHGYIRDANNQMVADDAGLEASGLIAARIRGWGRIQYMDNPKGRAEALQDEVGGIVAEALNAFWAAHGIKGDSNGAS